MPLRDSLLATLVAVIWGMNFVVIDQGLQGMPPLLFLALRFSLVLLVAIWFVPRPQVPWRTLLVIGAFMSLGQFALLYVAMNVGMPAGLASLVLQAQVMFTTVIAALTLSERPSRVQVAGLVVGALGLVVIAVGRSAATPLVALLLTVGAAMSWATGNVLTRRVKVASGLGMTVWTAVVVPLPMLGLSLIFEGPQQIGYALTHVQFSAVWSTVYTALLASLVGYGIWNTLLGRYPAASVVPFALLVPVVGMSSAWLLLGEAPNAAETLGGVILLLGVATITLGPRLLRPRGRHRDGRPLLAEELA